MCAIACVCVWLLPCLVVWLCFMLLIVCVRAVCTLFVVCVCVIDCAIGVAIVCVFGFVVVGVCLDIGNDACAVHDAIHSVVSVVVGDLVNVLFSWS